MINLGWQEHLGPEEFVAEINSYLPNAFAIVDYTSPEDKAYGGRYKFEIVCNTLDYFNVGFFNPTDKFYKLIANIGMKHFGDEPTYNNTGSVFWFYTK